MIKSTKRAAELQMKLKAPTMHSEVNTTVSPQQWGLISSIINSHHPSHIHKVKGGEYTLLHIALSEKDQSQQAVYMGEDGAIWVRPLHEFLEKFSKIEKN